MFSIFKKDIKADFSFLRTDMHSHLIPGVDDGSKSMEDSLTLIRQLASMGFEKIITTPHINVDYYPNTSEIIKNGLAEMIKVLQDEKVDIEIEAAAEYYIDDYFKELVTSDQPLLTFSNKHILIECLILGESIDLMNMIFELKARGFRPILAHPERYLYYANRFEIFKKIYEMGCKLQVNLLSLAGHYGREQKKLGIKLLEAGIVDYLGTDLHRESHIPKIKSIFNDRKVRKLILNKTFQNNEL